LLHRFFVTLPLCLSASVLLCYFASLPPQYFPNSTPLSLLLYINGQLADLEPGQVIAQTRQVNDLNSLDNRQASYTNKFSLPKSANNIKLLDYLTLMGNSSNVPYQKNTCSLYSHTGECFVYNGWAVITDGGDSYDCVVYDGIIDLYKAIDNKTLADLDLSSLTHLKNPASVVASWTNEASTYRYIVANYNGDTSVRQIAPGYYNINMDYFVPSVNVAWLWHKVFDAFNDHVQPTGSIFSSPDFTNLWMTFPKGVVRGEEQDIEVFLRSGITLQGTPNMDWSRYLIPIGPGTNVNTEFVDSNVVNDRHLKIKVAGRYRLEFSGEFNINKRVSVKIARNSQNVALANISNTSLLNDDQDASGSFEYSREMLLNVNDTLAILLDQKNGAFDFHDTGNSMQVRLVRMEDYEIDFTEAFSDLSIRDFLNEVVYRFGLTIFKDKYSNNYRFATLEELLETAPTVNWSRKFVHKVSEDYLTGSYAQQNVFSYTYNDKEATYNDGYIDVLNKSLPESKTLFKSKIYSPELQTTPYPFRSIGMYKMWEKEFKEETRQNEQGEEETVLTVSYKPLNKRYYFMYADRDSNTYAVQSFITGDGATGQGAWYERFTGLSFKDIAQSYYAPITNILGRALVVTAQLYLSDNDVANFNFNTFYYIEQLGGSFLVNKINNYIPGKPVTCELIRVRQGFYSQMPLSITAVEAQQGTGNQQLLIHFISQLTAGTNITLQYQVEDTWVNPVGGTTSPIVFNVPSQLVGQTHKMRLWYQDGISNQVTALWLGTYTLVL